MEINNNKAKLNPSNYNIDDNNLLQIVRLEYTLIEDFLIRTKLLYTHSIFNNEIKSIIKKPLNPFDDGELMNLLGINLNEFAALRFNGNNSNDISSQIKSTYLYQILNSHSKIMKIDNEHPKNELALYNSDVTVEVPNSSDVEIKLKNIEDKYNRKLKEETDKLLVENINKYKKEIDKKNKEELKKEIEKFKSNELSKMRMEENEKYLIKLEELRNDFENEYKKKYEELKNLQKSMEERESKLANDYEEKYNQLRTQYEGKEKDLDNKYKNDMDVSVQRIKFNEELNSLRNLNNDKENKIKKYDNSISILNTEIDLIKKDISDINDLLNNQPYLRNNYIKQEEKKKINYNINNNIKPSKESVLNSLNILAKSTNNINKSRQSQSGSGVYKSQNKKDRRKIFEEIEEEQYKLNNQIIEEFQNILNTDFPLLIEKDEYASLKKTNNNNADYLINQFREKYLYNDNNVNKNNNIYNDYNKNKDNNEYNKTNNIDNKYENKYSDNYDNISSNNNNYNNLDKNKAEKNNEAFNSSNNNSKKRQNNSINKSKNNISPNNNNNIGGFNIGGFNLGNYNFGIKNNNYTIKSNNSESIIEENLEGETKNNQKKENSIKKNNNFINSNRYEKKGKNPPIKEENEENFQDSEASNNSKQNNNNNNLNVNKSNKFNNYDYNDIIKNDVNVENEIIQEDINYGNENDISSKKKLDISASISGIAKKQAEVSESAGGFGGLLQLQSHAGGLGYNDKESYGDFEFSKGKNNNINNKRGTDKGYQNKFQNYQNNGTSEDIEEEISQN